jgi:hypothetical protein
MTDIEASEREQDIKQYGYDRLAYARKSIAEQRNSLGITEIAKFLLERLDKRTAQLAHATRNTTDGGRG